MEKVLIVYYSRTGTARQAAEELAAHTGWPLAEVSDQASRAGLLGDARCVLDILLQRHVGYRYAGPAVDECQRLVIVAPIWVGGRPRRPSMATTGASTMDVVSSEGIARRAPG